MKKPIVKKACFCQTLEKGARNGAIGNIFMGVLGTVASIVTLGFIGSYYLTGQSEEKFILGFSYSMLTKINVFLIFFSIFNIIAGWLMLSAIKTRDHKKMILMLISKILTLMMSVIMPVLFGISNYWLIAPAVIPTALEVYSFLSLYSYYIEVKNESQFITECKI
ncbi:hypothetical protein PVAND_013819 [Polypedilum vanderplanki]|uniref:Uncharacterized protein n=1 Tax=Polypedilum vanderplanki TaxID=319348 RepID=A0A9J6CQJ0_POLVA|nr:hypothetical protein PVAND_013819 [Polypedilum vanderplanki]